MTNLSVETRGTGDAIGRLQRYNSQLDDWTSFWPLVVDAFTRRESLWFGAEGEGSWPPLNPTYAAWKAQVYPGKPILVRTGDLEDELTDPAKAVLGQTRRDLFLGAQLDYARFHMTGTEHMPARRPLVPLLRLAAGIARLVQAHVHYPAGYGHLGTRRRA